ncbi:MAG: hypothetical protein QG553_172 [Patescibacteria group bacterium]|nr:hypothetical protein [Patescibacteria group bacterium]
MPKKLAYVINSMRALRRPFWLGVAVVLCLSFVGTILSGPKAYALATPQSYQTPKVFGDGYGFLYIDKDTILLTSGSSGGPFKDEVTFKITDFNKDSTPKKYYYEGVVNFREGDKTRSFMLGIKEEDIKKNVTDKKPIPIDSMDYSAKENDDGTNDVTDNFADLSGDSPKGYVFIDPDITDVASLNGLAGTTSEENATEGLECETTANPLTWIMCPLIATANQAVILLDKAISNEMTIDTDAFLGDNESGNGFFAAWNSFRFIALALLVIIALVMIFSEALSIDAFDAYTIRKVLPRLLIAIILVTLSWSLCKFAIEISNDLGQGVGALINAPFDAIEAPELDSGASTLAVAGFAIGAGSLGLLGLLSFGLTALLAVFVAFFVLVIRKMLILLLVILAPVAIVASVLPNTQRFWKMWWDFFIKALLAFPIIMAFIATGRVFSKVVASVPDAGLLEQFIAFAAYFLPYFMIPTAFKLAGGAVGAVSGLVNDRTKGLSAGIGKFRQNSAARHREHQGRRVVASRAKWADNLQQASSNTNRGALSRLALKGASKGVGGYNIQAAASARQASVAKELNDQIATGRDEEIRGLTVNKLAAQRAGALVKDADGHDSNGLMRINKDSKLREYKTLGGAWVSEGAVDAGKSRWKNDVYAQQAALSYEMRKAATDEQVQGVADRYQTLATGPGGWGMSDGQATGALKGAGFENQGTHLEFKHMRLDGSLNHKAFVEEAYEKKGSYPLSQMSAHTIQRLSEAYDAGDQTTKDQVAAISETFVSRYGGGTGQPQLDGDGNPIAAPPPTPGVAATGGQSVIQTNTPGAAHVAEEVRKLAVKTGVYQDLPASTDTKSTGPEYNGPRLK